MKDVFLPVIIGVLGISGLLYGVIETAEVKGYSNIKNCTGECYEEYVRVHGTHSRTNEAKRLAMQTETPADKGSKLYVNCNMCHGMKGEGGIGFALVGSTSIVKMLQQYKNGETRGHNLLLCGDRRKLINTRYGEYTSIH